MAPVTLARMGRLSVAPALNRVRVCGTVYGVHTGYSYSLPTVEFTLVTEVLKLPDSPMPTTLPQPPLATRLSSISNLSSNSINWLPSDKEQFTLRCIGSRRFVAAISSAMEEGCLVELTGSLRSSMGTDTMVAGGRGASNSSTGTRTVRVSHMHTRVEVRQAAMRQTAHTLRLLHLPSSLSTQAVMAYLHEVVFTPDDDEGDINEKTNEAG